MCIDKNGKGWKLNLSSLIQIIVILIAIFANYHFSTLKVAVKFENHELRITQNEKSIETLEGMP